MAVPFLERVLCQSGSGLGDAAVAHRRGHGACHWCSRGVYRVRRGRVDAGRYLGSATLGRKSIWIPQL